MHWPTELEIYFNLLPLAQEKKWFRKIQRHQKLVQEFNIQKWKKIIRENIKQILVRSGFPYYLLQLWRAN